MTRRCANCRRTDDRGVTLVLFAISLVAMLTLAGLAVDGGRLFASRRQMQNASDAAAMAATRALDQYQTGQTSNAAAPYNAGLSHAQQDGAPTMTCRLLSFDRTTDLGACPTVATGTIPKNAFAVRVTVETTEPTYFAQVAGMSEYSASATATAVVGKPVAGAGPFLVCANAPGAVPPILVNANGSNPPTWVINNDAIGVDYEIYGNAIKQQGAGLDCGDPASNFRGLSEDDTFAVPGWWETKNGNKTGPTKSLINSGNVCRGDDFGIGCLVVLPLCSKGSNTPGNGFQMYCVDLGLFEVSLNDNHDIRAIFRGRATLGSGGGVSGPPDKNGARFVQLTE